MSGHTGLSSASDFDAELKGIYEPPTFALPHQQLNARGKAHSVATKGWPTVDGPMGSSAGRECKNGSVEGPQDKSRAHPGASRATGAPEESRQQAARRPKGRSWWFSSANHSTSNSSSNSTSHSNSSGSSSSQESASRDSSALPPRLHGKDGRAPPPVLRCFAKSTPWGSSAGPGQAPSNNSKKKDTSLRDDVKLTESKGKSGSEQQGAIVPSGAGGGGWRLLPTRIFHWQGQVPQKRGADRGEVVAARRRSVRKLRPTGSFLSPAFAAPTPVLRRMPASLSLSLLNALSLAHPSTAPAAAAAVLAKGAVASLAVPAPLPQGAGPGRRRRASPWYTRTPEGGGPAAADPGWRVVTSAVQRSVGVVQGYAAVVTRGRSTAALDWGEAGFRGGTAMGGARAGLLGGTFGPSFGAQGSSGGRFKGGASMAPGPRPAKAPPPVQRSATLSPMRTSTANGNGKAPPPPPPPPPGMLAKGAFTKGDFRGGGGSRLKRSSTMGQLYRGLKSRMEMGGLGARQPGAIGIVAGAQGGGGGRTGGWERGGSGKSVAGGVVGAIPENGLADALLEISRK